MIKRNVERELSSLAKQYPVLLITGPRQSGKTTLCQKAFSKKAYVSLEAPESREYAVNDPKGFLRQYPNGAIIDEVQRAPELASYIQGIVDKNKTNGQFVLTGSQNFQILNTINQSLAGRSAIIDLLPFSISEIYAVVRKMSLDDLLLNGFYPRIYDQELNPTQAMSFYFRNYVERDIRDLLKIKDLMMFEKFVRLCAGRVGQILNLTNLGNEVGISHTMAKEWLSVLQASYIVFLLPPYYRNFNKRLIKSPKLYFYDVGLASYLLNIEKASQMKRDPLRGYLFENLVVMEILKKRYEKVSSNNLYFYRESNGNEIDLVLPRGDELVAIEIKAAQTINQDFFKGFLRFTKTYPEEKLDKVLVYAGEETQKRSGVKIYPFTACQAVYDQAIDS